MRQKRLLRKHRQAGFTLIELLAASVVLIIGVAAMSGLVALAVKNNGHNRLDSTATMLNQAVVEQLVSGINYQQFGGTGTASLTDCGSHTTLATAWPIQSTVGEGAPLDSKGNIDFTQAQVAGYSMNYVVCVGSTPVTYDVRWNISPLPNATSSFTNILTVGSRMMGGPSIINFPINMRVMVGPDPAPGS